MPSLLTYLSDPEPCKCNKFELIIVFFLIRYDVSMMIENYLKIEKTGLLTVYFMIISPSKVGIIFLVIYNEFHFCLNNSKS